MWVWVGCAWVVVGVRASGRVVSRAWGPPPRSERSERRGEGGFYDGSMTVHMTVRGHLLPRGGQEVPRGGRRCPGGGRRCPGWLGGAPRHRIRLWAGRESRVGGASCLGTGRPSASVCWPVTTACACCVGLRRRMLTMSCRVGTTRLVTCGRCARRAICVGLLGSRMSRAGVVVGGAGGVVSTVRRGATLGSLTDGGRHGNARACAEAVG